jgi:hypothetical protein
MPKLVFFETGRNRNGNAILVKVSLIEDKMPDQREFQDSLDKYVKIAMVMLTTICVSPRVSKGFCVMEVDDVIYVMTMPYLHVWHLQQCMKCLERLFDQYGRFALMRSRRAYSSQFPEHEIPLTD